MNNKNKRLFFLVFSAMYVVCISADQQEVDAVKYPNFAKLITKYSCSKETQRLVQAYHHDIKSVYEGFINDGCIISDEMNTFIYQNIPYIKKHFDVTRIKNAQRLEKVIKRFELDRLRVAKKCIAKDQQGWFIVAEKIDSTQLYPFSLEEIQQLAKIVEETGFSDWGSNIVRDEDGILVFIDTEDVSFTFGGGHKKSKANIFKYAFYSDDKMEPEAARWLKNRIKKLRNVTFDQLLCFDTQYDDASINFEKVIIEYQRWQKAERFKKLAHKYGRLVAIMDYIVNF